MYVAVNIQEEYAAANGFHPILYVSSSINLNEIDSIYFIQNDSDRSKSEELIIMKFDDRETREPVMFG